jgi:hypothetical protein
MRLIMQLSLYALAVVALSACSAIKKASTEAMPKTPAGTWSTEIMGTPMGNISAEMVLMKEGDSYTGYVLSGEERMDLEDLEVSENKIRANFFAHSYNTEVTIDAVYKPETDTIEGWLLDSFRITGKRKEVVAEK